jgi:hypothetical protein
MFDQLIRLQQPQGEVAIEFLRRVRITQLPLEIMVNHLMVANHQLPAGRGGFISVATSLQDLGPSCGCPCVQEMIILTAHWGSQADFS